MVRGPGDAWGPVEFSDQLPPEVAFEPLGRPSSNVSVCLRARSRRRRSRPYAAALPSSPDDLATNSDPRLHAPSGSNSWRSPTGFRRRRRAPVGALAAGGGAAPTADEPARVVRARAALHLYRRPYALALPQGLDSPEARAVLALAQGNLFEAEALVARMSDPLRADHRSRARAAAQPLSSNRRISGAARRSAREASGLCRAAVRRYRATSGFSRHRTS